MILVDALTSRRMAYSSLSFTEREREAFQEGPKTRNENAKALLDNSTSKYYTISKHPWRGGDGMSEREGGGVVVVFRTRIYAFKVATYFVLITDIM